MYYFHDSFWTLLLNNHMIKLRFLIIFSFPVAGLVYMVLKHLVDRYNLYFAYSPSNISQNIHASAITNVIIAVFLPQISLFLFFFVHQTNKSVMYCSLIGFTLTLVVYFSHWMFQCCRGFSPFAYQVSLLKFRLESWWWPLSRREPLIYNCLTRLQGLLIELGLGSFYSSWTLQSL